MNHWIGWHYWQLKYMLCSIVLLFIAIQNKYAFDYSKKNVIASLLLYFLGIMYALLHWRGDFRSGLYTQIPTFFLNYLFIVCLDNQHKGDVLSNIVKWFAWMMIPALILYFVSLIAPLPVFNPIEWREVDMAQEGYGSSSNYFVLLQPIYNIEGGSFMRFRGPFLEPGHLGMMCAFLLLGTHFQLKNRSNRIILFTLLLTLSLAGYALALFGFIAIRYYDGKLKLKNMILYSVLLFGAIGFAKNYNAGDNVINERILSRLESDDEKGIAGNNRNTVYVNLMYYAMWTDIDLLLSGYDPQIVEKDDKLVGAGYTIFVVKNGLLAVLAVLTFYLFMALKAPDKKLALIYITFVIAMFWQRTYAYWFSWVICFLYPLYSNNNTYLIENTNEQSFS